MDSSQPPGSDSSLGISNKSWVSSRKQTALEIFKRVLGFPRMLVQHRDLIQSSVKRSLAARFQGTLLGFLWPLVHPLFIFAVYYFIFTKLLSFKMPALEPGQESAMGVYMFIGVLIWASLGESLALGCNVIVENGNLIKKLAFPSEILPLNIVLVNVVTMLFGVAMYLIATFTTSVWAAPGIELLWIPVLLALQILFVYGLVLILSALQVFLRDTSQVVSIVSTVWMFLTPLFWVPEAIPRIAKYVPWIQGNPMNHLVFAWREVLMDVSSVLNKVQNFTNSYGVARENDLLVASGAPPGELLAPLNLSHDLVTSVVTFGVWAVAFFVVGYCFFATAQRRFADEV